MTRTARIAVALVLLALVAAVAAPRLRGPRNEASGAGSGPGPAAIPVAVDTVHSRPLVERLAATGTLRANEQIDITSEIAGQVRSVRFREGTAVVRGAILIELADDELQAQRARARHRVELARTREARQQRLVEGGLVSREEYDLVKGELEVLEAELRLVEAQLEKTNLRAPFSGTVGLRYVSPGSYVTPQTRVASLADVDPLKLDFSVPERYADRVAVGHEVELGVAGVERRYPAVIYAVEPAVDPDTRSLLVRARLANPGGRLRPGMFAEVSVVVARSDRALTVPAVAVIPELGGRKVFVVEGGRAVARPIETGIRTEDALEVVSGLSQGDLVIVSGLERVSDGAAVEVR